MLTMNMLSGVIENKIWLSGGMAYAPVSKAGGETLGSSNLPLATKI